MKPLYSIQVLRGAAALAVVVFHAWLARGPFVVGQAGVDVFFVVSGFIMWLTTRREPTPGDFLLHRVVRIAPLYWLATLVMAAHLRPQLGDLAKSLLFIPSYNPDGRIEPVLLQGWTLNYEMFFYGLFAVALTFPRRVQLAVLTTLLLGLSAERLFVGRGAMAQVYTDPLLLEFLMGLVLGRLWMLQKLKGAALGLVSLLAGLGLMAATLLGTREPGLLRALVWGVPAGLIVMGALMIEAERDLSWLKPLAVLGDASYSLYLTHALVLGPVKKLLARAPEPWPQLAAIAASVVAALLVWRYVERPIGEVLRRQVERLRPRGAVTRAPGAAPPAAAPASAPAGSPQPPGR